MKMFFTTFTGFPVCGVCRRPPEAVSCPGSSTTGPPDKAYLGLQFVFLIKRVDSCMSYLQFASGVGRFQRDIYGETIVGKDTGDFCPAFRRDDKGVSTPYIRVVCIFATSLEIVEHDWILLRNIRWPAPLRIMKKAKDIGFGMLRQFSLQGGFDTISLHDGAGIAFSENDQILFFFAKMTKHLDKRGSQ